MKKEYLILVTVIISLCAYLVLKKDNQVNYQLPILTQVETVDMVEITRASATLTLAKTEKGWTLAPQAYPVSQAAMDDVLDTIKGLTLSSLASETGDLVRYDLDKENAILVKASAKGKTVREFSIGKTAPSFNHTFVMLSGDKRIYQADKSFRNSFDKSGDDFRDKVVLSFKSQEIRKISLEKGGKTLALDLTSPQKAGDSAAKESDTTKEDKGQWVSPEGSPVDQTAVQDLLASLSHLECQGFKDAEQAEILKKGTVACKISLENGTVFRLNLFDEKEEKDRPGTSSQVPFAFDLASYKADDILSYVDKILGIKTPEKN